MSPAVHSAKTSRGGRRGRPRGGGVLGRAGRTTTVVVTQELIEEERSKLIQERQGELQRVLDRHDDLVCPSYIQLLTLLIFSRSVRRFIWRSLSHWSDMIPRCVGLLDLCRSCSSNSFMISFLVGSEKGQVQRLSRRKYMSRLSCFSSNCPHSTKLVTIL